MRRVPVVLLLGTIVCGPARGDEAWIHEIAERVLMKAGSLDSASVGEDGGTPATAIAYRQLLRRPDAVDVFARLLEAPRPTTRLYGLVGLRHVAPARFPQAAAALVAACGDPKVETFSGCIVTRSTVIELVRRIEAGRSDDLRAEGDDWRCGGRGRTRGSAAGWVDLLIAAPDAAARFKAADALVELGPIRTAPELPRALRHESPSVRLAGVPVARELSPWLGDLVDPVLASLRDPDDEVRHEATWAIGQACGVSPAAERGLAALLRSTDDEPRFLRSAILAAGSLPGATFDPVVALLQHADEGVRGSARDALEYVAGEHPDPLVRERAAGANAKERK